MKNFSKVSIIVAAMVLLASSVAGFAAEPKGWQGEVMPFLWYAGLEGDVTVDGQKTEFEKSASDLINAVDFGGTLLTRIQYNRIMFYGGVDYFSLSTNELDVEDRPQGGSLDTKMTIGEVGVGYVIDGWKEGQAFAFLIGARMTSMDNDLTVFGEPPTKISKENDLTDPLLIVAPGFPLFPSKTQKWRFSPSIAIGAGGDSDLVYELFLQFRWQISDHIAARFGYRTMGYKFEDKEEFDELNTRLAGLIVGVGGTF